MLERLKRLLGLGPDEYALLRLSPTRAEIDRVSEPIPSGQAEFDYDLRDGKYQLRAVNGGRFGESVWTEKIGNADRAKEIEALRSDMRDFKRSMSQNGGNQGTLKERTIDAVLRGDLDPAHLETVAALNASWENPDDVKLSDIVDDPTDLREVAGAGSLKILENYSSVEDLVSDITAGGARGLDRATENGDDSGGDQDRRERREQARRERQQQQQQQDQQEPTPDVARPEARYRLRFPDQYTEEQVAEAREVLPEEEVADIEEKRERTRERERDDAAADQDDANQDDADQEGELPEPVDDDELEEPIMPEPVDDDAPAEAAADGGEALEEGDDDGDEDRDGDQEELVADGGADLFAGTEARVLRPGALGEFVAMFRRDNSREEIEEIAPPWPGGGSKATRDALQAVTAFDGLAFPEGRHGRRRFLENLAEHVLSQPDRSRQPRLDGGHMARQGRLVEFAQANPFKSAAVVVVALLILVGRRGDRRER